MAGWADFVRAHKASKWWDILDLIREISTDIERADRPCQRA